MENITALFQEAYLPKKAIVIFQNNGENHDYYVEAYDMDRRGCPINAHPLSVDESIALAKALDTTKELQKAFLKPKGLLPENVLYLDPSQAGCVLWYTPAQERQLFFSPSLGIANEKANVPPMIWLATKEELHVFATNAKDKPKADAALFHAPFFNLYNNGRVCMGTVDVDIKNTASLEDFMQSWETYFFNSYFSHLIEGHNPINGNLIQLWQQQVGSKKVFPQKALKKNKLTLKDLISWNF